MRNKDILYKLLHLEKIYKDEIDKEVDDYLNFLTKKISWFILNPTGEFYCRDYYKKASRMRPWKSKYIKLKYFYHWKFPPKYKDSEIPEIPINEETKMLMSGEVITEENLGKEKISSLLKRGLIQHTTKSSNKSSEKKYESTGVFFKYYHWASESEFGDESDNFRIFNLNDTEIIFEVKQIDNTVNIFTFFEKGNFSEVQHKADKICQKIRKAGGNPERAEILNKLMSELPEEETANTVKIKPYSAPTSIDIVVYPYLNRKECFQVLFKSRDFIEKSIKLPYFF